MSVNLKSGPVPASRGRVLSAARSKLRETVRRLSPRLARRLGSFYLSEDRLLLEQVIFPYLRDSPDIERILFVGCDWYTEPYQTHFRGKQYWTLDVDPAKRRFGASKHVCDALRNLTRYASAGWFDTIICNGVFMKTAIETPEEAEPSFAACNECLREGGWFVLGWNDTDDLRPYPPDESPELRRFEPTAFPPLGTARFLTNTSYRHTYSFYRQPRHRWAAESRRARTASA